MKPRDMTAGQLLAATRAAGFAWCFHGGYIHADVPIATSSRKDRCRVDALWRECRRRGRKLEGFVELTLHAENFAKEHA